MFRSAKSRREPAAHRKRFPDMWRVGEDLADDRAALLPAEDRPWDPTMADAYLREVRLDAMSIAAWMARREDRPPDIDRLTTVAMACGLRLESPLHGYLRSGWAEIDRNAIRDHHADYDSGRELAEATYARDPAPWLETAPMICTGILLQIDIQFRPGFRSLATRPPFGPQDVALSGFKARMADLVRARLSRDVGSWQDERALTPAHLQMDEPLRAKMWSAGPRPSDRRPRS